ncbi:hypothetical protein [Cystobacter fuscus]|uniref:hypothetical protein n=1 Tax=Cystobacter fuscus TaxID=43 RepID=UPI0012FE3D5A|nr:hypothetical protein [Cystobacter fuscus]
MMLSPQRKGWGRGLGVASLLLSSLVGMSAHAAYVPPADQGAGVPPPSLASQARGSTADGSNNDVGYCHAGYCISSVSAAYYNARKIKFNVDLIAKRDDPNLHQVSARAFHPYYVTRDENFSSNDCIGGWRLCNPKAVYDMEVRKISSCSGMPADCIQCLDLPDVALVSVGQPGRRLVRSLRGRGGKHRRDPGGSGRVDRGLCLVCEGPG